MQNQPTLVLQVYCVARKVITVLTFPLSIDRGSVEPIKGRIHEVHLTIAFRPV